MPWWGCLILALVLWYLYLFLCVKNVKGETRLQGRTLVVVKTLFSIIAAAPLVYSFAVEGYDSIFTLYIIIGAVYALHSFPKVDYGVTGLYAILLVLVSASKWKDEASLDSMNELVMLIVLAGFILSAAPKKE